MIFARRGIDIAAYPAILRHLEGFRERLEPKPAGWAGKEWGGRKAGPYQWFEIQDSVAYWELFDLPKIVYQEIQFHPWYCMDRSGRYTNNKAFILAEATSYVLAVLNSPVLWWHNWRRLPHMKDEALSPVGEIVVGLPIAPPTPAIRAEVEPAVERLIAITQADQEARAQMLDWLRVEFEVEAAGRKLEDFGGLSRDGFVDEVKARLPRAARALSPAGLKRLRETFDDMAPPVQQRQAEAGRLERRVAELVNQAYGLTPEDVALLWRTAPPRMPVGGGDGGAGGLE